MREVIQSVHDDHGSVAHHHGGGFPWRDGLVKKGSMMSTKARLGLVKGSTLPNGGIVLDSHVEGFHFGEDNDIDRQYGYVIALLPERPEYATWSFVDDTRGIVTLSGHYHHSLFSAVKDFARRIGQAGEES
jgi:hypothetical protein